LKSTVKRQRARSLLAAQDVTGPFQQNMPLTATFNSHVADKRSVADDHGVAGVAVGRPASPREPGSALL
jgi:hypothetical protein